MGVPGAPFFLVTFEPVAAAYIFAPRAEGEKTLGEPLDKCRSQNKLKLTARHNLVKWLRLVVAIHHDSRCPWLAVRSKYKFQQVTDTEFTFSKHC